jgi:hypothetical protein
MSARSPASRSCCSRSALTISHCGTLEDQRRQTLAGTAKLGPQRRDEIDAPGAPPLDGSAAARWRLGLLIAQTWSASAWSYRKEPAAVSCSLTLDHELLAIAYPRRYDRRGVQAARQRGSRPVLGRRTIDRGTTRADYLIGVDE